MPQCKQVAESKEIIIVDLTKLIGKLGSTAQAILPAQIQVRYLQGFQIQALKLSKCYHVKVHIDQDAKEELFWWIENLRLYNGKSLILLPADLGISTDASTKGWVATCQGISTWTMVRGGTESSHQHTRAEGSAFSHIDFCKNSKQFRGYMSGWTTK